MYVCHADSVNTAQCVEGWGGDDAKHSQCVAAKFPTAIAATTVGVAAETVYAARPTLVVGRRMHAIVLVVARRGAMLIGLAGMRSELDVIGVADKLHHQFSNEGRMTLYMYLF
eukprot:SAG22_NODE_443_length_10453_cov_8.799691_10_plen_113_part_00